MAYYTDTSNVWHTIQIPVTYGRYIDTSNVWHTIQIPVMY